MTGRRWTPVQQDVVLNCLPVTLYGALGRFGNGQTTMLDREDAANLCNLGVCSSRGRQVSSDSGGPLSDVLGGA